MQLGPITSDDLQALLRFPESAFKEMEEARLLLLEKKEQLLAEDVIKPVWCHLYEMPAKEHFAVALGGLSGTGILQEIASSKNQIQAMYSSVERFERELEADDEELDETEKNDLRKMLAAILGLALSVQNSLRCLLVFGCYLNDLIARVRTGGPDADKAMIQAIKIDATVLGCVSVVQRVSRAVLEDNKPLLRKVNNALGGQLTKREQRNYQNMRMVLQVLHESGTHHLSQDDLYRLFVEELELVQGDRDSDEGDVANNLRQFAYQFMKQKPVSQNV